MTHHIKNHPLRWLTLVLLLLAGSGYVSYAQAVTPPPPDAQVEPVGPEPAVPTTDSPQETTAAAACPSGTVRGYVRVKGGPQMPATYTTAPTWRDSGRNCSGGSVSVRRASTGLYYVNFAGNPSVRALAVSNSDGQPLNNSRLDNIVSIARMPDDASVDSGSFRVQVQDVAPGSPAGTVPQDGWFTILLF